ncbi:AfsR/SARP family transcriptional regulator [Longispora sp. NPDC051575]|uniref:AfsR/SARP family transcriptional regulator n=1 Tax=Longispora sp. NPDC051575 TaxID=3154943 RepID=UPI003442EC5A
MEFRVLGPVRVIVDGAPADVGGRRSERCLLGVLLLHIGSVVTMGRLTELLWDDHPPARSRAAVQVLASRLRSGLAAAGAERYGVRLVTRAGGYVLEGDPERVDAHRFRVLCDRARTVPDPAGRLALLREALALWQGPPLADAATGQVRREVLPGWEELRLAATEGRLDCQLSLGEHADVVDELRALVAEYPHRERLVELLMLGLYRAGRRQDALAVYEAARRELAERVGLDPTPALRDLRRAIAHSDPALDPAPRAAGARPAQLPPAVPNFTGRDDQLDALDGLADQPGAVVISTVGGVGGVGKTGGGYWHHYFRRRDRSGRLRGAGVRRRFAWSIVANPGCCGPAELVSTGPECGCYQPISAYGWPAMYAATAARG